MIVNGLVIVLSIDALQCIVLCTEQKSMQRCTYANARNIETHSKVKLGVMHMIVVSRMLCKRPWK